MAEDTCFFWRMDISEEDNLTPSLSRFYRGDLVLSSSKKNKEVEVEVVPLNSIYVKVIFKMDDKNVSFQGRLVQNKEGILMTVEEKLTRSYFISGISGFMNNMPNVHGGYVKRLNGFFFHVVVGYSSSKVIEVYFYGKEVKTEHQQVKAGI